MQDPALLVLAALLRFLGTEAQAKKVWYEGGFAQRFQLLGILFDLASSPKTASVPKDKVDKTLDAINGVLLAIWAPAELTQTLLGLLVFNSRVLVSGIWHLPITVSCNTEIIRSGVVFVTRRWKMELNWWKDLLSSWNRVALLVPRTYLSWRQEPLLVPMTDASRSLPRLTGAGGASCWVCSMFGRA